MVTAQATYTETESVPMEENKEMQHYTCTAVPAVVYHAVLLATEIIPATCPWYTRTPERTQKKKKKNRKSEKNKTTGNTRSAPRPNPEGTDLLFAGTISLTIFPVDGPTEGRHEKT